MAARSFLFALALAAGSAAAAPADDALARLRAIAPATPAEGLPYAFALERAGLAAAAADLKLGLFVAHVDSLNGHPWPPGTTLGATMDGAKALPAATPGTPLAAAWTSAFQRQVTLRWTAGPLPASYGPFASRLAAVRPGGWVQADVQPNRFVATVELTSQAPTPITLPAFRLRWGEGLSLDCRPVGPSQGWAPQATRAFVCEGWGAPTLRDAFALGAPVPEPGHLDTPDEWGLLLRAMASASRINTDDWVDRLQGRPDSKARQAAREAERRAAYRWYRDPNVLHRIKQQAVPAGAVLLALVLLAVGRRWRREGSSALVVGTMTVGVMALAALGTIVALWQPPSGEGWARAAPLFVAVWVGGHFLVATVLLLVLHRLLGLLDEDRIGWRGTVAGAWARLLDFRGRATRAEFWGYVGFWFVTALIIGVVVPPVAPVTTPLLAGLVLLNLLIDR